MSVHLRFALVALVILTGCEGAAVPLGDPDPTLFNEAVLGSWVSQPEAQDADSDRMYLRIFRFNEAEYYAEARFEDDEPDEWMRLRIYPTELEGVMFANIQCVGCEETEWLFFSWELADGHLVVTDVVDDLYEDDIGDEVTTQELRSAVSSRMASNTLFSNRQTYVPWTDDPEQQ